MAQEVNHQNNFATNLTSNTSAGVTTTPINSIPTIDAPYYIALDALNANSHYEVVLVTSDTATNINHAATTYAHTTAEEVRMVVPAAELDEINDVVMAAPGADGWKAVSGTWTYASATTITVPAGAASLYSVGDKIKLTQTTAKYFYVVAVADTLLTVTGGSDYTVANAAITSPYISHVSNPVGFPQYFAYTPTGPTNTTLTGRFTVEGRTCFTTIKAVLTGTPNWTNMPTLPITVGASYLSNGYDTSSSGTGGYLDSGTANSINGITPTIQAGDTTCRLDGTANSTIVSATNPITWAVNDTWIVRLNYEI